VYWDENTGMESLRAALPEEIDLLDASDKVHQLLKQFNFSGLYSTWLNQLKPYLGILGCSK